MENLYTYAVARVKTREDKLLGEQDIAQAVSAKSYDECIRMLSDKGFDGGGSFSDIEELLSGEHQKLWEFISELTDDMSVFDVFRIEKDFHNLKAAIKARFSGGVPGTAFVSGGTMDTQALIDAVKNREFNVLPEFLADAASEASAVLNKTGDGQKCDIILDKAMIKTKLYAAEKTKNEFLIKYAKLYADISALKVAVRCCELGKDESFMEFAIPDSGFNRDELIEAALYGKEAFLKFLECSEFSGAVPEIEKSYTAFEKWCDNRLMELVREQKSNYFTIAPVAAYILARENEIRAVRIILSAKLNGFSEEIVTERLRDMYV